MGKILGTGWAERIPQTMTGFLENLPLALG